MRRLWMAALMALATVGAVAQVKVEQVNYRGWARTLKLSNGLVEVYVTTDVGPRIIDFRPVGGNNIFHVRADEVGKAGEKEFKLRGGWRPWLAPEVYHITWFPDNVPCKVERLRGGGLRVYGPREPNSGIQKIVEVRLYPDKPCVRVTMRLRNVWRRPVTYAAWSLPVMKPGGRAIVPLDVGNLAAFADIRRIVLWSYANPTDPRFSFFNRLIVVDQAKVPPREKVVGTYRVSATVTNQRHNDEAKIGTDTKQGWVAYYHPKDRVLFVKRFPVNPKGVYPDGGCTVEVYSCQEFIEVECLSHFVTIRPGSEFVFPMEFWLFKNVDDVGDTEDVVLQRLQPYLKQTRPVAFARD
ncbi:hypothetical protein HRbin17_01580 [bacterium HR17]|uniref:DUF4380 domain-containing protein n=1 Tax=Candidatus Fervidibacter japonicus TaxID=2035412 RepID=A0A2H5XCZ0_9BACT|nr:hypothetical protein HRbin17_01580 [bacterium HR17]